MPKKREGRAAESACFSSPSDAPAEGAEKVESMIICNFRRRVTLATLLFLGFGVASMSPVLGADDDEFMFCYAHVDQIKTTYFTGMFRVATIDCWISTCEMVQHIETFETFEAVKNQSKVCRFSDTRQEINDIRDKTMANALSGYQTKVLGWAPIWWH